jgi:hypothetical protein
MTNLSTCKQNPPPKKITNVENCEKTPTIKQFVYYFLYDYKMAGKKKVLSPPPPVW